MNKNILPMLAIPIAVFIGLNGGSFLKAYKSHNIAPLPIADLECPKTPNCVSSRSFGSHHVAALDLGPKPEKTIRDVYKKLGITITQDDNKYLRAEAVTGFYKFVDDVDIALTPNAEGLYDIRSASRVGAKDFGVNRRRVEMIRKVLVKITSQKITPKKNLSH